MEKQGSAPEGYLTVFLSLSLPVMLSLILTLVYGTRIAAVRMQTQLIMDTAENSCLGEYSRELLSQYDLLFIDTAYGTASPEQEYLRRHLEDYVERNCETGEARLGTLRSLTALRPGLVSVDGARYACDQDYTAVLEQIHAYLSADPAGKGVTTILSMTSVFDNVGLDPGEWQQEREAVDSRIHEVWEEAQEDREEGEEIGEPDNPAEAVDSFRMQPLLAQVFGQDAGGISDSAVDPGRVFSHRQPHYGEGLAAENSHDYAQASGAELNLYLAEKCGSFRHPKEGSLLRYEREYIVSGKACDRDNLEAVLARLCGIRTAANCMYLFSDAGRRQEARAMAETLAAVTLTPALIPLYTTLILLAWGYVESISDLRTLTGGGKVPLLKDSGSWQTQLGQILHPDSVCGSGSKEGWDYDDYLGILLFAMSRSERCARLMDLCEMDIRLTPGNKGFCMDGCLDTFTGCIEISSAMGYTCTMTRTITYN